MRPSITALPAATAPHGNLPTGPARRRLGRPRLLIVGCGDIGLRIVARLRGRLRVFGTSTGRDGAAAVRAAGGVPLALDLDRTLPRRALGALASRVLVLAPPSTEGRRDARAPRLLRALAARPPGRLVYVSTTGVYGDRRGQWVDETAVPAPRNDRAWRRLDAEHRMRESRWHGAVLRVPGIYGPGRLPLDRLRAALPVPYPAEDNFTNHIHADDLARACVAALYRAAPARVYNTVDDTELRLGEYLDRVANHAGLPRPPRAAWDVVAAAAGPQRLSFMNESRRVRNRRMKRELRLRLRYGDIDAGLRAGNAPAAPGTPAASAQASKSPSTDR